MYTTSRAYVLVESSCSYFMGNVSLLVANTARKRSKWCDQ